MNLIIKIFIFLLLVIEILYFLNNKKKSFLFLNEKIWIIFPWTICLFLYYFSGIKYTLNLDYKSFFYILLFWIAFFIGNSISKKEKIKLTKSDFTIKHNLFPIFIISLISSILYCLYILKTNNIQIGITRNINTNAFATFLLLLSNSSLIIWLYELAYSLLNNTKITLYGICSIIIYNIPCMFISGRDALIIFILLSIMIMVFCANYPHDNIEITKKQLKKLKKRIIIMGSIILCYLILISNNRYGSNESSAYNLFEWSAGCKFPAYLNYVYYNWGGIGKVIVNIVFYYSSQFSKFSLIYSEYNGPYLYGFYELHYLSRILPQSLNLNYTLVSNSLLEITRNSMVPGIKGFWDTCIGYMIYDYGKIGAIIMSFIWGFIIRLITNSNKEYNNIFQILTQAIICIGMFLTIEVSPLFDYYYIFPLIWLIIIKQLFKDKYTKKHIEENDFI